MRWRLTAVVVLALILTACQGSTSRSPYAAPEFTLKDLSGHDVQLASFKGHPVLLDFWATWCGPCRMSIPRVQEFYAKYKDQGLMVLGLNVDDDPSPVIGFVKQFGMTYPVLLAGSSEVSAQYDVEGIPTFVFIDQQGRVVKVFNGFSPAMPTVWEEIFQHLTTSTT